MKVVFFLLDAFRQNYISKVDTPFLFEKANEGTHIEKIIPSAGFCERTEIFFGLKPNESGFFTAIGFDAKKGVYREDKTLSFFGKIENICSNIIQTIFKSRKNQFEGLLHKIIDRIHFKFFGSKKKMKTYKIPHSFLKYFNLTEDEFESIDDIKGRKSLFKIIEESKMKTYSGAFTSLGGVSNGDDSNRIKLAIEASKSHEFIPVYINCVDSFGHEFGPNSKKLKNKLFELDKMLESAVEEILENSPDTNFYFLGDHGMTEVQKHVDIKHKFLEISKKNNLKIDKDFIYFLDSTLMRIWFFNDQARKSFEKEFNTDPFFKYNGVFIDETLTKKFNLPLNDRRYGDIAWWANEGVLIFPDFFHNKKIVKGMHGYQPITQSTYGTCIVWDKKKPQKKIKELELSEIYNFLKEQFLLKK